MTKKHLSTLAPNAVPSMLLVALLMIVGTANSALSGQGPPREVTFTKDIAPILQRLCEHCHRTNGVAPMPLTTYAADRWWLLEAYGSRSANAISSACATPAAMTMYCLPPCT